MPSITTEAPDITISRPSKFLSSAKTVRAVSHTTVVAIEKDFPPLLVVFAARRQAGIIIDANRKTKIIALMPLKPVASHKMRLSKDGVEERDLCVNRPCMSLYDRGVSLTPA